MGLALTICLGPERRRIGRKTEHREVERTPEETKSVGVTFLPRPFPTLASVHPVLALFRRNAWATERLLDFCEGRPEAAAAAEADVYGGIEPMFNHIVGAETGYLRLLTGELPEDRVRKSAPRSLGDLREPARWLAERWTAALDGNREDIEWVLPYRRGDDAEVMPDWLPLVQCVHHGDDHRTQVDTLLSRRGVESPWLDGWAFGEEVSGNGAVREWWATLLRRFFGHHLWATERLLERLGELSPEQLALSAPGTYGPIGATLDHLLSADRSYLSRLKGGRATPPLDAGGPEQLLEHLARQREGWLAYLDSGPDFDVMIERREGGESAAWVLVLQAIQHGNDHRTHAGTVLLSHQLEAPEIDVWGYAWAEGALRPLPRIRGALQASPTDFR
jgi:uncharacterized damage-inducible protein DinB